ncbi:MAG: hypothetical protein HY017_32740 [Betaproteobacteria bacterium]|nr:hypothetical protein [Betaproteobacteria bacterium]
MPLVIRLDTELEIGLRALSSEERVPPAEIVRRLIREHLAAHSSNRSAFQIAEDSGVIGIDRDTRRNVSEKHSRYLRRAIKGKGVKRGKRTA